MNFLKYIFVIITAQIFLSGCGDERSSYYPPLTPIELQMLIPLYSHPTDQDGELWNSVALAAQKIPITVIFGVIRAEEEPVPTPPDVEYLNGLQQLRNAGVTLLAYVETTNGERPIEDVKTDVKAYSEYYDIDGIFYDEVSNSFDDFTYYEEVTAYAKSFSTVKEVMLNSSYIGKEYIQQSSAENFIIFEGYYVDWLEFDAAQYTGIAAEKLNVIVNQVSDAETMQSSIDSAIERRMGNIYVTDQEFDLLPSFFAEEVNYIAAHNEKSGLTR